jgi:hypothetical protein
MPVSGALDSLTAAPCADGPWHMFPGAPTAYLMFTLTM